MKILLVDDDDALRSGLAAILRGEGWSVVDVDRAEKAPEHFAESNVLVTDMRMPGMTGLELLKIARAKRPDLEIIMMTAYATVASAVDAMKEGARAYLTKPFDPDELILHLREVDRKLELRALASRGGRGELAGVSRAMKKVYAEIDAASSANMPVLLLGETGTGKELAARAIHEASSARTGPFIAVNLGALPRDLVESELFGHERGAFTGAHARKRGRFELARGGTLFLDEIDSLPVDLQPKLLRAIETSEIWPLGAEKAIPTAARIIAATNADIAERIEAGTFRRDLFFRISVLSVVMPPLRERAEDIPVLAPVLLDRIRKRIQVPSEMRVASEALSRMMLLPWRGNVRELSNFLERGLMRALAAHRSTIEPADLEFSVGTPIEKRLPFREAKEEVIEQWTKGVITSALAETGGNTTEAARNLQMGRTALLRLISKYGLRMLAVGLLASCAYQPMREPRSLIEERSAGMARQTHEFTCGAAAVATILTSLGKPMTEKDALDVVLSDTTRAATDTEIPPLSAADLEKIARAYGYRAVTLQAGTGPELLAALERLRPIICRIVLYEDYLHFVVIREARDGWVFVSDPAYGNIRIPTAQFAKVWETGDRYFVVVSALPFRGWKDAEGNVSVSRDAAEKIEVLEQVAPFALYAATGKSITFSNRSPM